MRQHVLCNRIGYNILHIYPHPGQSFLSHIPDKLQHPPPRCQCPNHQEGLVYEYHVFFYAFSFSYTTLLGITGRNYFRTPVLYNILLSYFILCLGTIGVSASETCNILQQINSNTFSVKPYFFVILYSFTLRFGFFNL